MKLKKHKTLGVLLTLWANLLFSKRFSQFDEMIFFVLVVLSALVWTGYASLTDGFWSSDFVAIPLLTSVRSHTTIRRQLIKDGYYRPMYGTAYDITDPTGGHLVVYPPRDGCQSGNLSLPIETAIHFGGCDVSFNAGFYDVSNRTCLGYAVSSGRWEMPLFAPLPGHRAAADVAHTAMMLLEGVPACSEDRYNGSQFLKEVSTPTSIHLCSVLVMGFVNASDATLLRPYVQQAVSGQVWLVRQGSSYVDTSLFGGSPVYREDDYASLHNTCTYFPTLRDAQYFRQLVAPRLAIGVRVVEGSMVVSVVQIDGYNGDGVNLDTLTSTLLSMGFTDAINLDGGGSVAVYEGGGVDEVSIGRDDLRSMLLNGSLRPDIGVPVNTPSNDCPMPTYPRRKCPRPVATMICLRLAPCKRERQCLSERRTVTVVNSMTSSFSSQFAYTLLVLVAVAAALVWLLRRN